MTPTPDSRLPSLAAWQWRLYPDNHCTRNNLILHILTVPMFQLGTLTVLSAPWTGLWSAMVGLGSMAVAVIAQGKGHAQEAVKPVPFAGPFDAPRRIFLEQWFTFPRFVLSGGFSAAWRKASLR
jgi:hypothetical protein